MLISLYKEYADEMDNPARKKRDIWIAITEKMSTSGYNYTQNKIECKWRNLVKCFKQVKDNKESTGGKRRKFQYYEELCEILCKRHDLNPPFVGGSGSKNTKKTVYKHKSVENTVRLTMDDIFNTSGDTDIENNSMPEPPPSPENQQLQSNENGLSRTPSAIKRRKNREESKGNINAEYLTQMIQMNELRQKEHLERERSKSERHAEKTQLFRELIDVLKQ